MSEKEAKEQKPDNSHALINEHPLASETIGHKTGNISTQQSTSKQPCACGKAEGCSCGSEEDKIMSSPSFIYAIGKVVHRFPTRSLELELAQATGRRAEEETRGRTHEEVIHNALTDPANRYIARQICYVLNIEGLETYLLIPTDPLDIDRLADALRPAPAGSGMMIST